MKVNFKNCRTKTLSSQGTEAFMTVIVEGEYHIAINGKCKSQWYRKNFTRQKRLHHQRNQRIFVRRQAPLPSDSKMEEKYFLIAKWE